MTYDFLNYFVAFHLLAGTLKRPTLTQGAQDFQKKGETTTIRNTWLYSCKSICLFGITPGAEAPVLLIGALVNSCRGSHWL